MKMKSEEEKTEAGGEEQHDAITVKAECKSEQETSKEDEDSYEDYTVNGDDLNILIKEEPHSREIDEDNCVKIKLDAGTVCQDLEGQIKAELGSSNDDRLDYESGGAAIKEETESWVKEETQSEEDAEEEDVDNIDEDFEEGEVVSTESSSEFFPCPHCTVSFTNTDYLEKHVKWVHQKEYLDNLKKSLPNHTLNFSHKHVCSICSSTFKCKAHLSIHMHEVHPSAPPRRLHPCPHCARSFQYLKNLKNHCQRWHNMSVVIRGGHLSCADCGKSFKATWGQGRHLCHEPDGDESEERPICLDTGVQCSQCGKKLRTPQSLEDHMRTHTGDRPFICKDCGRRFGERSSWRQHMKIHLGEKPFKCEVCGKAFIRSHHLKSHLTTHSGKKEYSCPECGKEFGFKSSLDLHVRTHSSERPFHCNVCGKNFNTRRNLRVHTKLHNNEKAHKCGECGLEIRDLGALKVHLRTHTGERPYHCTVCGNRFIRLAHLRNHQRIHSGERPYKCNECDKSFTQSGDLVKHKRIHSGEKPYECPECHRCYTSSGDLGKHRRSHTNLRPYTCKECGKTFRLSGHLKTHMLTHTGEKPYSCPNCLRRFARSHHLSGHVAKCR